MRVLLVIPAYNEEANILNTIMSIETFKKENSHNYSYTIDYVVINDGSTDKTQIIIEKNEINAVHLVMNLGIGGAVQTGYRYAEENDYDIAVQFDGDGQHDINSLDLVVQPIIKKEADFVIGSRFLPNQKADFQTTFMRRVGIKILSFLIYLSSGQKIYDVTSGYRACNKRIIGYFSKKYPTSYPEPESTVHLLKKKFKIKEVAVNMMERSGGQSSIRSFTSIKYMFEVSIAIIVSGFMREGD
ncbi:glycosyl transferase, group 2 family protein [Enterococcus haemoperoxidus ATCC BAA-382]|uniref:Glycosyl transferase, group 2 family protein n=1 Tax=Enterococcus haemoperoxidus ATCC BAA-382 TaxID=1158608 RepID=R2QBW1_9ENTE|nr:glycosyltransferase family 2 protein [Enterococcus haemoperoxidus]EOH92733.1 glycosyl transferase, group 2 family protein [Enterococcus haemoperoxidus ATCC BAA-382]EOT61476.1 glycosyl transferase, group 2 family protein [Enterococcus haemoperoxidus ATCC BAA-382]OJG55309.1 glycosyl transferase, group 2 family protein [Enterococcus haemoperoxidus]